MRSINWRLILGIGLLLMGVLALLQALDVLSSTGSLMAYMAAAVFMVVGLAFIWILVADRSKWWPAIPGIVLVSLAILILWTSFMPRYAGYAGSIFLLGIGIAFWVVYLKAHQNWWAIIPAGVMTTLAVMTGFVVNSEIFGLPSDSDRVGFLSSGVLFLGLAVTFALLSILPTGEKRMRWPWIPAGILLLIAIFFTFSLSGLVSYVGPAVLILAGIFLAGRAIFQKGQVKNE